MTDAQFPGGSDSKASVCNAGGLGSIPGLGRSPGEGNGNPLQYSCLENSMRGGAWWATVHGVANRWTLLSNFTSRLHNAHPYPNAEHPVCKMTPYPQLLYKRTNFSYKHKGIVHLADTAWHTQLAFCLLPLFINRGEIYRRFTMSRSRVHS